VLTFLNSAARAEGRSLFTAADLAAVNAFFDALPDLAPSPLRRLSSLARRLRLEDLLVKDESARFGLNAFKVVGVTYALERLAREGGLRGDAILACASTGNHGRAVARAARLKGFEARIYLPAGTERSRVDAVAREGAHVVLVQGSYDDAVRTVAADAASHGWTLVSDTAGTEDDELARWIMAGYTRILEEASQQWSARPDVVIVQAGVGGLAAATASWAASRYAAARPLIVACEPDHAACLMSSVTHGRPTSVSGSLDTIMAGLRCGEMSEAAWPAVRDGIDGFVTVTDEETRVAMDVLAHPESHDPPIVAGPSGACGMAALLTLRRNPDLAACADALRIGRGSRVLAIVTEGAVQSDGGPGV
jgi:diaminopropionate ammonia-lyase